MRIKGRKRWKASDRQRLGVFKRRKKGVKRETVKGCEKKRSERKWKGEEGEEQS